MAKKNAKWEMQSIENFVEQLLEEERETYTRQEIIELSESLSLQIPQVTYALEGFGIKAAVISPEKKIRTYSDNPHNLWNSPGMNCGGGSGGNSIMGLYEGRGCSRSVK